MKKSVIIALLVFVVLAVASGLVIVFSDKFDYMFENSRMIYMHSDRGMRGFNIFRFVWMFVLFAAPVLTFLVLSKGKKKSNGAMLILDRRLADGEITIDEYQELKKVLKG